MSLRSIVLLVLPLLVALPATGADLWMEARGLALERDALGLRYDLDRRSGAVRGGIERTRREFLSRRPPPSEQDTTLERLERRLMELDRDLDRLGDRRRLERSLARTTGRSGPPEAYRPPWPEDLRGDDRLIGVGKLVVRVQRSLRRSALELTAGRRTLATRYLADAEQGLAGLGHRARSADPNTVALRAEAARLRLLLTE